MPPSLDDDIPPSLDDDIPPELEDDDDITPSMEDAAEGSAGAEGPILREQMLSASEGAIQKKKEARKKEEKKVTKNFGKESFKKGFLAAAKSNYSVGTMVELHSLSSTSLNGRVGKCGKYDEKEGRYAVTLLATKTKKKKKVAVRPTNLRRAQDPDVIRPKKESEKKNPLQFDEVQEALKATQKLQ